MERDKLQESFDQKYKSQIIPNQKEQGRVLPGFSASQTKQANPQKESAERSPLPSAWDILERKAACSDKFVLRQMTEEEYDHEGRELDRLKEEVKEKGPDRDKHILALLYNRRPHLIFLTHQQQQIQQWRLQFEYLSDHDFAECARKQKEEIEAFQRGEIPLFTFHPSVGDGEHILIEHIAQKGKRD